MLISFKTKKEQNTFSREKTLIVTFGPEQARKIMLRFSEIQASNNLEVLRTIPQTRAHELTGNRKGQISLDLKHPYRLIITPDHEDCPRKKDGGLDWGKVTKVKILAVEDTHE
jgi:plasmid maintenance system killer protein